MSSTPSTDIMDPLIPLVTFPPANRREHTHTVIVLHGENETARSFAERFGDAMGSPGKTLVQEFPTVRWVFPMPKDDAFQWFATGHSVYPDMNPHVQVEGLRMNVARIRILMDREADTLDGRYHRVVLAGFGAGAGVAAHTLINLKIDEEDQPVCQRLGGLLCVSGRMPFAGQTIDKLRDTLSLPGRPRNHSIISHTPILIQHCEDDDVVDISYGHEFYDGLGVIAGNPVWRDYPRGGHWFGGIAGIDDAVAFLGTALGMGRWGRDRGDVLWSGRLPMPSRAEVAKEFGQEAGQEEF